MKRLSPGKRAHLLAVVQQLPRARVEHALNQDAVEVYDWRDRGYVVSGLEMLQHGLTAGDVAELVALARRQPRPPQLRRFGPVAVDLSEPGADRTVRSVFIIEGREYVENPYADFPILLRLARA